MKLIKRITTAAQKLKDRLIRAFHYCVNGVWSDTRQTRKVKVIKTLNLSARAFFDGDTQSKACAMTFRTMLALIPALALVFAIGRGFGLQEVIKDELIQSFQSQRELLTRAFTFVDTYLDQASGGIFVGVGVVMLLWTLISIVGSVEKAFNDIWGVKEGRSIWRKITDYLAIFLVLPVLMICASGITVFVSASMDKLLPAEFSGPLTSWVLDIAGLVLIWFFFTGVYMLIPNTKVKFRNAFVAGIFAGTGFMVLQWLFVTGQIYVSKYNAIYGSIAFLPLLLIWLQLAWVVTLAGAIVCYASQNIFRFNFNSQITRISPNFKLEIVVSVMTIVVTRYLARRKAPTEQDIINDYGLPPRLVATSVNLLVDAGLLLRVVQDTKVEVYGYVPATDPTALTLADVMSTVRNFGASRFVPGFEERFASVVASVTGSQDTMLSDAARIFIKDLTINSIPAKKSRK